MSSLEPLNGEIIPPQTQLAPKPKTDDACVLEDLGEHNGQLALTICERLASEPEGLTTIAAQVRGWGDGSDLDRARDAARQFYRWRIRSAPLSRIYARAMQSRSHVIAHRLLEEIDSEPDPHMARVKMDAMKWLAAKFNRADFGDEPPASGVSVTINNDAGVQALQAIQDRIARKRKSMLIATGGGVEVGGTGEGEAAARPPALPSGT